MPVCVKVTENPYAADVAGDNRPCIRDKGLKTRYGKRIVDIALLDKSDIAVNVMVDCAVGAESCWVAVRVDKDFVKESSAVATLVNFSIDYKPGFKCRSGQHKVAVDCANPQVVGVANRELVNHKVVDKNTA